MIDLPLVLREPSIYLLIALLILGAIYIFSNWPYKYLKTYGIPGPKPRFPWGNLKEIQVKGKYRTDAEWINTYGGVVGFYLGRQPAMLIGDPEILEQIMVKQFHNFTNRYKLVPMANQAKEMVLNAKDERWKYLRTILSPSFSAKKLKEIQPLVQAAVDNLDKNCKNYVESGEDVEMNRLFGCFTMDVIATTAFGVEVDSQKNPDNPFVKNASNLIRRNRFESIFRISFLSRKLFKFLLNWKLLETRSGKFFSNLCLRILDDRKKSNDPFRKDILQMMIDQQNKDIKDQPEENGDIPVATKLSKRHLTDSEIIAQSTIFFLAGYETTATTLSFMSYLLAMHQDIQDKVYQEIQSVIGKEAPDYTSVQKLTYLSQCLSETLRLYPIASSVLRKCKKEITINNWTIPEGISVNIPIYAMHHNAKYWPDPEKFDPDRFSEEAQKTHTKFTYMPFGAGPRICIGMRLAQMEVKFALTEILTKYKLVPTEKTENPLVLNKLNLLSAKNGIWMKIVKR